MAVSLVLEFLVTLFKVIWITLVAVVKNFLPWKKKDASKEVVLITGAGSGIGRMMALEFAKLGATLILWDINEEGNDAVKEEIESRGGVAHAFKVDCSKREEIYAAADKVRIYLRCDSEFCPTRSCPQMECANVFSPSQRMWSFP